VSAERLRITEIFYSLQGEAEAVGWPTIFIRLTGCPLRCGYCDTTYAFQGGQWWTLDDILQELKNYQTPYVTVTGGEPLAQKSCFALLTRLSDAGYQVSLETSGALDIDQVDPRVSIVMDIKTPSSGEVEKNLWDNLSRLKGTDQVKLVIANREDYEWSVEIVKRYQLEQKCTVLFSPVEGELEPRQLADWILEDQLPVRFQIQLHKYLWDNAPGR
jgi:7-carboxy-7-deazaguanine synthase